MKHVPERDHVGRGQRVLEEVAAREREPSLQAEGLDVSLEAVANGREVEARGAQVRVALGEGHEHASLGAAEVEHRLVAIEREPLGDRARRARAESGHPVQELCQSLGVGVQRGEEIAPCARLVLRLAGLEPLREPPPERVQPGRAA